MIAYNTLRHFLITFPRKRAKSPMELMVATRRAFSTRMPRASRAEVQKLVLLMAVAVYAFLNQ